MDMLTVCILQGSMHIKVRSATTMPLAYIWQATAKPAPQDMISIQAAALQKGLLGRSRADLIAMGVSVFLSYDLWAIKPDGC